MIIYRVNVILNKSELRPSRELSCFTKSFFDELYDKFNLDDSFWDVYWFNLYIRNYDEFAQNIKEKYNVILNTNDIPTILIKEWRYNQKLIDYIIKEKKQDYYLNAYINGNNDRLYIAHVDYDDYNNHEICYGDNGEEILQGKLNYKEIIQDLQSMLLPYYRNGDHLEEYFKQNNVNKYTYMCFKKYVEFDDTYRDYWLRNSGKHDKEVLDIELVEDCY